MIPNGIVYDMHPDLSTALRGEIRAEMARQHVTREALAAATQKHPQTVGKILSGKSALSFEYACVVADSLGVPLSELIDRASERAA